MKMNKKTLIITTICSLVVLGLIIVAVCLSCGENDENATDETTKSNKHTIVLDDGETIVVGSNVQESFTTSYMKDDENIEEETTSLNMLETAPIHNDEAETEEGHTTKDLQATEPITFADTETSTTPFVDSNGGDDTVNTTTSNNGGGSASQSTTTPVVNPTNPTTSAQHTTTKTEQPTSKEEETTTTPVVTVASGWKPEMVTEFYTYFKKYINDESMVSSHLKKRYDAICSNYLNSTFGCSAMITALEAQWEVCTCDMCLMTNVYDLTYRFSFSEKIVYGAEIVTVDGYGSEAVSKIVAKKTKAVANYAYVNIYYDANTNKSTAYICTRGTFIDNYGGCSYYDGDELVWMD